MQFDFNVEQVAELLPRITENLNYRAEALNKIFPKYFKRAGRDADKYHRQPEKIANVIYANRMDNGDIDSGDGWHFRGGGILQLTGRYNYTQFGKAEELSASEATDFVRTPIGALASACWFWDTNNINRYCDTQDIVTMTKRINGGTIGLADRKNLDLMQMVFLEKVQKQNLKAGNLLED